MLTDDCVTSIQLSSEVQLLVVVVMGEEGGKIGVAQLVLFVNCVPPHLLGTSNIILATIANLWLADMNGANGVAIGPASSTMKSNG